MRLRASLASRAASRASTARFRRCWETNRSAARTSEIRTPMARTATGGMTPSTDPFTSMSRF